MIDHVEEHTIEEVKESGFWTGITLYPMTKCSPARAVNLIETYGAEKTWLNSAADWGVSDPLATVKAAQEMRTRGHPENLIRKVFYENPRSFLSQCPKFKA